MMKWCVVPRALSYTFAPSTSVIGFCGRFRTQKNPLFLLDVFAEYHRMVPDSLLMLVGIGELRSLMDERIEQLGIKDSVLFMGLQRDVSPYYQAMDAFLLPSLYEGLGIVYVEAQCAGLPCFASADAVPPEAKVTDLLHYVSLKESAEQWAQEIRDAIEMTGLNAGIMPMMCVLRATIFVMLPHGCKTCI